MGLVFGPVPSRRLGRSLGINNIPPKVCTYACIYCQLGNTIKLVGERGNYYSTGQIVDAVENQLNNIKPKSSKIDYLTFVPDGEPTLDLFLGDSIRALRKFGTKIAVITNSSLLWDEQVREDLKEADWVSLKIDTLNENSWHRINRPHGRLKYDSIFEGIKHFSEEYDNFFSTETMLLRGLNDSKTELESVAHFIKKLDPDKAFISIPTRPPAEAYILPPDEQIINMAYQIFTGNGLNAELITGYEGNEFSATGNLSEDILNITAVHPMRHDAVEKLVEKNNGNWEEIKYLVNTGRLIESQYEGNTFYLRNLREVK